MTKKHKRLRLFITVLLLVLSAGAILGAVAQSGFIQFPHHTPVQMILICDVGGCPGSGTGTSTVPYNGGTVTASGVGLRKVAETWQQWTVHYTDGRIESRDVSSSPAPVYLDLTASGQPAWLDITFPISLTTQPASYTCGAPDLLANPFYHQCYEWHQEYSVIGLMSLIVDNAQIGGTSNIKNAISFTSSDQVGTVKSWTARIIFSGSPGAIDNTLDVSGALSGKSSAHVQVVLQEVWTTYQVYTSAPLITFQLSCNGQQQYIVSLPARCQLDQEAYFPPGGIWFDWHPGALVGGASLTWATNSLGYCPSNLGGSASFCIAQPSFSTVIVTRNVSITQVALPTVAPVGPSQPPNATGNNNPPGSQGAPCIIKFGVLGILDYTLPAWLGFWICGKTLGVSNWILLILGIIVLIVIGLLFRRPR